MKDLKEKINQMIIDLNPDLKTEEITPEKSLRNDLGLDSLGVVELAMNLERNLNLKLSEDIPDDQLTVQDIYNFAEKAAE